LILPDEPNRGRPVDMKKLSLVGNNQQERGIMRTTPSVSASDAPPPNGLKYVPLPQAPQTASPTPWLTSIHGTPGRGPYGDPGYRGNCSGLLIRDLLCYFQPASVLDPMSGGGTCADVCSELGIVCKSFDLRSGFDACDPECFKGLSPTQFIWLHPPYFNMIRYSDDPRCLSNAPTVEEFFNRLGVIFRNCSNVLTPDGKLAVLMGDGKHAGEYLALPFKTMNTAMKIGFWPACPEIIRFGHGSSSADKRYTTSFIPRVHDVCLVLKKTQSKKVEVATYTKQSTETASIPRRIERPPSGVILRVGKV
jgi:hypothetical protein